MTGWKLYDDNGDIDPADLLITFSGQTIGANDYLLISPNATNTLTTYGVVSDATYVGALSNGGESLLLVDESANTINAVAYDDIAPWPLTPDGTGPSLELKSTNLDNSVAANWNGSLSNGGTPLALNSVTNVNLASITSVNDPNNINANQAVNITATITGTGITSTLMKYKIDFGNDVTVTMFDDGAHNDGAADDDVIGSFFYFLNLRL